MGHEATVKEILPPFTPIRMAPALQLAEEEESPAPAPTGGADVEVKCATPKSKDEVLKPSLTCPPAPTGGADEEVKCATPKSKDKVLKPSLTCPPAPRKPRPQKRKLGLPPRAFFVVTRDLTSVFVGLSDPVKKKIKVG